jgi:glutathione S-transferase
MFFERATEPLSPSGQDAADKLVRVASALVPEGASSLFGAFCIADADLGFMLHRLILNGHDVPTNLRRYAEAQWTRPSVREFVEHSRPPYGVSR